MSLKKKWCNTLKKKSEVLFFISFCFLFNSNTPYKNINCMIKILFRKNEGHLFYTKGEEPST